MKNDNQWERYKQSRFYSYFQEFVRYNKQLNEKGIKTFFFQTPLEQKIKGFTSFEKERLESWTFDFNNISEKDSEIIKQVYPEGVSTDYLVKIFDGAKVYIRDGYRHLYDFRSEYVNIVGGRRITLNQPSDYIGTIYICGQCTARGTGVEDSQTISSFLQAGLNKTEIRYRVVNLAIGCGSDIRDDLCSLSEISFSCNDIVVFCTNLEIVPDEEFEKNNINYFDTSFLFEAGDISGEWFTDSTFHTTKIGNEIIAKYILEVLNDDIEFNDYEEYSTTESNIRIKTALFDIDNTLVDSEEIANYISLVKNQTIPNSSKIGSIVMNCNPFTKGHRYLIEKASSSIDWLYIFVVQEDKSFFLFEDRLRLVRDNTKDLKNVIVVPSGKFIISAETFPGYFYKDGNTEIEADVSTDINIFGEYIAKNLGITVRYVGEEPYDYVTRKYNEEMKRILPTYGIELVEIPRSTVDDKAVSASNVRALLKEKRFEEIKELVPETTYIFLKEKYD